jgi:hypothetical protein
MYWFAADCGLHGRSAGTLRILAGFCLIIYEPPLGLLNMAQIPFVLSIRQPESWLTLPSGLAELEWA